MEMVFWKFEQNWAIRFGFNAIHHMKHLIETTSSALNEHRNEMYFHAAC